VFFLSTHLTKRKNPAHRIPTPPSYIFHLKLQPTVSRQELFSPPQKNSSFPSVKGIYQKLRKKNQNIIYMITVRVCVREINVTVDVIIRSFFSDTGKEKRRKNKKRKKFVCLFVFGLDLLFCLFVCCWFAGGGIG
jgi:hypothetical protein